MRTIYTYSISIVLLALSLLTAHAQDRDTRITIAAERISLRAAFDTLTMRYSVPLVYLDRDVEGKTISIRCTDCSAEDVLSKMLENTGLSFRKIGGQFNLVKEAARKRSLFGTIAGTVTDSLRGEYIEGANVVLYAVSTASTESTGSTDRSVVRVSASNRYGFFSLPRIPP